MELTCAFVLTLVSLVAATPHGYGVKGGASAKAEASAVAGAFSGLGEAPHAVPAGTGYSGSFSKSSASSFASSSASASSSSNSFSYSGAGAGGLSGTGTNIVPAPSSEGCGSLSGGCKSGGDSAIITGSPNTDTSGANLQTSSGANSAAISESGVGSSQYSKHGENVPCTSGDCSKQDSGCDGVNCEGVSSTGSKCTTGQCGSNLQTGPKIGSNDIPVNIAGSKTTYNSNDQLTKYDKSSTGYSGSGSDCSGGNCSPSSVPKIKPILPPGSLSAYPSANLPNENQPQTSKCDSPTCYGYSFIPNSGTTGSVNVNIPATYLTTPKEASAQGPTCTSPNCKTSVIDPYPGTENLPSSYNVPIHGTYLSPVSEGKRPINNPPNAAFTPTGSGLSSTNYLNSANLNTEQKDVTENKCTSSDCTPGSYNIENTKTINYPQAPSYQITSGPSGSGNCASGNCGGYPSTQINTASDAGISKPNYVHGASPAYTPTGPTGSASCVTPDCAGFPSNIGASTRPTNPSYLNTALPSYNNPSATSTNCGSANCAGYSPTNTGATSGASSSSGSFGILKPNSGVNPTNQKLPSYTGGFGGPSGLLKPNDYTVASKPSYTQQQPAIKPNHPSGSATIPSSHINPPPINNYYDKPAAPSNSYNPIPCSSGDCISQPGHSSHNHGQSDSTKGSNAAANAVASANAISYVGGFGGPPGFLKPYDDGKIRNTGHTGFNTKYVTDSQIGNNHGSVPSDVHSSFSNPLNGAQTAPGPQIGAGAHAGAVASAKSDALSGTNIRQDGHINLASDSGTGNQAASGCTSGCSSNGASPYGGGANFGLSGGLGFSKTGILDGLGSGLNAAGAVAKSVAGAVSGSGAGSFGLGGSFATSAANAHASSGAFTKGGYGR